MKLSEVFANRPDILADVNKLKSVFADYYTGDISKINRMMKAYEVGVVDIVSKDNRGTFDRQKLVDRLVNEHDMVELKATEAIDEWYKILTLKVVEEYKKYSTIKKQEPG